MKRTEHVETLSGMGTLRLVDRYLKVKYVIRKYQNYDDDVPTTTCADGGFVDLPAGDASLAMMDNKPLELDLDDGCKAKIFLKDPRGDFIVTGPIV